MLQVRCLMLGCHLVGGVAKRTGGQKKRTLSWLSRLVVTKASLRAGKRRKAGYVASVDGMSVEVRYSTGFDYGMVVTAW